MARAAHLMTTLLAAGALALAGCSGNGSDSGGDTASTGGSSASATATPDGTGGTDCPEGSNSPECQAAPGDGETVDPDRCGSTPPSAIAGGLVQGTFGPWCRNAVASTYNTAALPESAAVSATVTETEADTTLELVPQSFPANTSYTAVLHSDGCGADPDDAGAAYEDNTSGQQGRLTADFTTDGSGNAQVSTTVPWLVPDDAKGKSLLLRYQAPPAGEDAPVEPGTVVGCITLEQ